MTRPTLEQLDAEIAALERELEPGLQRLRTLKRLRRPLAAAAAAAAAAATRVKARKRQDRNDRIASAYGAPGDRTYGSRLELARQHRLSVRTISRAVEGVAAARRAGWAYRIKPLVATKPPDPVASPPPGAANTETKIRPGRPSRGAGKLKP